VDVVEKAKRRRTITRSGDLIEHANPGNDRQELMKEDSQPVQPKEDGDYG